MSNLAYILLNILFITVPFLLLQTFSQRLPFHRLGALPIMLGMGLPLIGCMVFPFAFIPGYEYDLKFIPLLAGSLYGGFPVGAALALLAAAVRHFVSDQGTLMTLAVSLAGAAAAAGARPMFFASGWSSKLGLGAALSLALAALQYWGYEAHGFFIPWDRALTFTVVQTALFLLVLVFSERLREFASARTETVRMEKLTANSSLAVIIAHELRNPLTTVHGFLQLMKRQNPSEQILYYLNTAMQELNEAEKVIHTYLTITTLQDAEKEDVALASCIDAALEEIWPAIEQKRIDLVNAVSEDAMLHCNEPQLRLCLLHLLRNGVNALHRGGKLTVSSYWRGKELAIVVGDNGIGMTEEQLEQLGMPKYNTRSSGTGTGLMYCYHFVHSMNGRLRIQSQPGRGTVVTVTIPAHRSA